MNWTIEHIEADNYVKIAVEGIFSIEEHAECFKKLFSSPFWKPGMNLLYDNRNFDFTQMNFDKVKAGSNNYQKMRRDLGEGKMALLVGTPLGFGIGRQFGLVSEDKIGRDICIFKDEKEAIDWLLDASDCPTTDD